MNCWTRRSSLAAALVTAVQLTAVAGAAGQPLPAVPAPASPEQVVRLRDGSFFRGELIELVQNDHVTLRLGGGELRRFVWSDIAELGPPAAPPPSPEFQPPPPLPEPQPPLMQRATLVNMRSDDPAATLFQTTHNERVRYYSRRSGRTYSRWEPVWDEVCRTPCGVMVDLDGLYSIRGLRINASAPFVLPASGAVTLQVKAGHSGPRVGGILLTSFGGILVLSGIPFFAIGAAEQGPAPSSPAGIDRSAEARSFLIGGGSAAGVGLAMLAGGIAMLVASRTTVQTLQGDRLTLRGGSGRPSRWALSASGLHF